MDLGIHVANFTWPGSPQTTAETLTAVAKATDRGGFASLSVMDHFFQMEGYFAAEEPMLEGYTTLGYLAAVTESVQLRLLVTGVTYRHPGVLAKIVSTVDVLSEGRGELGIGAAWYEREHAGLGVPFPPTAERFERLEETLQICLQMWSDDTGPYQGVHYQLGETLNEPNSISKPHPPIMIGGSGEKKTLRLVAKYADACNLFVNTPDEATHKLEVLRQHCLDVGTDYDAIRKTILYVGANAQQDGAAFIEEMRGMAAVGIEEVQIMPFGPDPAGVVERIGKEIVPAVTGL
ncbi:MAG: LLM class F420-dependent oxidoreductase [Acidimicrobiia bacterium]|nr:LLM class F420-dependent oxidoreductase [Acidimicrobiia bacterium]